MQPQAKVTRLSTALELDMTGVVEETARLVLDQVGKQVNRVIAEQTMPALVQILEAVERVRVVLDPVEAQAALDRVIPRGYLYYGSGEQVNPAHLAVQLQVELTRAGYGLVPIGPQVVDSRVDFVPTRPNEVTAHRVPGVDVDAYEARSRAEARLAASGHQDELDGWTQDLKG